MDKAVFGMLLVFCFVSSGLALSCYSCEDCLPGVLKYAENKEECSFNVFGSARCAKEIEGDGTVNRYCATVADCSAKELISKCTGDNGPCTICCSDDDCNSASTVGMTMATLITALVACWFTQ